MRLSPWFKLQKSKRLKIYLRIYKLCLWNIKEEKNVRENHKLLPLTLYNKFKGMCEPILFKYTDKNFEGVVFRPATVCGFSPKMRFDLSVNILTNFAYNKKFIKVFGGKQLRPNLHISDYCDVVLKLIKAPSNKIKNQIFNVGNQNMSIDNIAKLVKMTIEKNINLKLI